MSLFTKVNKYGFEKPMFSKNTKAEALGGRNISTGKENFDREALLMIS